MWPVEPEGFAVTRTQEAGGEAGVEPTMTHTGRGVEEVVGCGSGERSGLKI